MDQSIALLHAVQEFLFAEAELLDGWKLQEWLALMTPEIVYEVPPTDELARNADPALTLALIRDDIGRLRSRVDHLLSGDVLGEAPPSRTRRLVTNIRVRDVQSKAIQVTANFAVYRYKFEAVELYVGRYEYRLVPDEGSFKIDKRRAILDLESLVPHGKLSIIL